MVLSNHGWTRPSASGAGLSGASVRSGELAGRGGGNRIEEGRWVEALALVGLGHSAGHVVDAYKREGFNPPAFLDAVPAAPAGRLA